jgi:hypothetical protein
MDTDPTVRMESTLPDPFTATKVDIRMLLKVMPLALVTTLALKVAQLTITMALVALKHLVPICSTTETFKVFTKDKRRTC